MPDAELRATTLSVVIPAFNEEARLPSAIVEIHTFLRRIGIEFEILVVDDGSTDGTWQLVQEMQSVYPTLKSIRLSRNQGKGAAVKTGVLASSADFILFTDADQSTNFTQVLRLLTPIVRDGFDIAMGSRALADSRIVRGQKWYRRLLGKGFGGLTRILLVRGFNDCQCGFKCFRSAAARRIFENLTSDSAIFDMEVMLLAAREALNVAEVPIEWCHDADSRLRYDLSGAIGLFHELLRMRRRWNVSIPLRARVSQYAVSALDYSPDQVATALMRAVPAGH
jgi:dolichyl-phosphate beta-glucosyltransferase